MFVLVVSLGSEIPLRLLMKLIKDNDANKDARCFIHLSIDSFIQLFEMLWNRCRSHSKLLIQNFYDS